MPFNSSPSWIYRLLAKHRPVQTWCSNVLSNYFKNIIDIRRFLFTSICVTIFSIVQHFEPNIFPKAFQLSEKWTCRTFQWYLQHISSGTEIPPVPLRLTWTPKKFSTFPVTLSSNFAPIIVIIFFQYPAAQSKFYKFSSRKVPFQILKDLFNLKKTLMYTPLVFKIGFSSV